MCARHPATCARLLVESLARWWARAAINRSRACVRSSSHTSPSASDAEWAVGVGAFTDLRSATHATLERSAPEGASAGVHNAYRQPYDRYRALYPAIASVRHSPASTLGPA